MEKRYLDAAELLRDSWELARRVYASGWHPTHLAGLWRGGAPVAVAVQEWLAFHGVVADHCAIRTRSYTAIGEQAATVSVDGLESLVATLHPESRLLLVDDIFDSGRSLVAVVDALRERCGACLPHQIRTATVYYHPRHRMAPDGPTYHVHETECWLVFPHELLGLGRGEIARYKPAVPLINLGSTDELPEELPEKL
jgi:hypoxanthine phosphoribosyltransferase